MSGSVARRSWLVSAITLYCALAPALVYADDTAPSVPAATPEREATTTIHRRGRYPDDLLVAPPDEGGARGRARTPIPIFGGRGAPTPPPDPAEDWLPRFGIPGWLAAWLRALGYLGYVLVIAALVAMVALILWLLFKLRLPAPKEPQATVSPRAAELMAEVDPFLVAPELAHDELARQGRFREAVHALLVSALLSTGFVAEGRARGATAREIVRGYAKPSPPREPLVTLLAIVERVWFGGRTASRATYDEALASYVHFVPGAAGAGTGAARSEAS